MGQDCTTVTRLANVLLDRYRQTADMGDLLEAKSIMEAALKLPELDDDFFEAADLLSTAFLHHHKETHDPKPLREAIGLYRAVIEVMPSNNANYHPMVLGLGQLLFNRSAGENSEENFEEAASLFFSILGDSTLATQHRILVTASLSANYTNNWERLRCGEDLDTALTYSFECVDLCPPSNPLWFEVQTGHAMTLWSCSKRDDDGARHQEAVEVMENLIQNHADKVHDGTRMNYASLLDHGYRRTGDFSLLERSIAILKPVVQNTTPSNPMRGTLCVNFGNCLQRHYDHTSDKQSVIDAHQYYVEALNYFPQGHPLRGQIIISIQTALEHMQKMSLPQDPSHFNPREMGLADAMSYLQRLRYLSGGTLNSKIVPGLVDMIKQATRDYQRSGSLTILDHVLDLLGQSLSICTAEDSQRAWLLQSTGAMRHEHFARTRSLPSLHAAISAYEQLIELSSIEDEDLLSCMSSLAQCLDERSQHGVKEDDLQASIAMHRRVMDRALAGHPQHVNAIIAMTTTLDHMAERLQNVEAGEEAIRLYQYLLESCELLDGQRVVAKGHYALALINRYQSTDELAALDEAITLLREVLILIKPDSALAKHQRATFLHNLGAAVHMRHEREGDMDSLDEAIKLYEELLNLLHPSDSMRSVALMALGNGYFDRGSQRQDMDELAIARGNYESALSLRPRGHPNRSNVLHSLSQLLQILWSSQQDPELLIQAMEYVREGLELSPYANGYVYIYGLKRLAEMDVTFFHITGDNSILDEAVQLLRQAIALLPPGQKLRGPALLDLAGVCWLMFLKTKREVDLRESKRCLEEAMRVLSNASRFWYDCNKLRFRQALQEGGVSSYRNTFASIRVGIEFLNNEDIDIMRRVQFALVALRAVRRYTQEEAEPELLTLYTMAIEHLPRSLAASEATPTARYQLLEEQSTGDIGRNAFMLALKLGVPKDALRLLETCRAAFWSQALWTRVQLDGLPADISKELQTIFQSLEAPHESARKLGTGMPSVWEGGPAMEKRRRQRRRLEELATSIRELPGHDRFMLTPTYEGLRKAAAGTTIVILAHDATGSAALVLRADGQDAIHVPLPNVTEERLKKLIDDGKYFGTSVRGVHDEDRLGLVVKRKVADKAETDVYAEMWTSIVQPILHALGLKVPVFTLSVCVTFLGAYLTAGLT
jgi:tetratricopeptide (TPR) repeat protein